MIKSSLILILLLLFIASNKAKEVEIFNYKTTSPTLDESYIYVGPYEAYINKLIAQFFEKVDREAIEQSPYIVEKDPEISELIIFLDDLTGEITGSSMYVYQEGLDEDGQPADISWSVSIEADENGNTTEDSYYFEWSGH